ncbi:MAG: hypothetical protein AABY22_33665 [Nanoarchaeota archaeon]
MKSKPTKTIWVTKTGDKIRVKDMENSHLVNVIKYLRKTAQKHFNSELKAAYCVSSMLNGEMAQLFCEQDIERMEDIDIDEELSLEIPCYDLMLNEVFKRGLKID